MLILTRKVGQRIMIGDDIVIEFLSNDKGDIRVGVIAPENTPVHREEVYWRIKDEVNEQEEQIHGK